MSESISRFTTISIGGRAERIAFATSRERLVSLAGSGVVLGGGSNVLVSDRGYNGTVVLNRYADVRFDGELVTAGSGTRLSALCAFLMRCGLSGLEWAAGIPGTAGGAVRMNAGAFGGQMSDRIVYADVWRRGEVVRLGAKELGLAYRSSALCSDDVVIDVALSLERGSAGDIRARMARYGALRRASQPRGRTAGCVFKNPPGQSIAALIERAGLKGMRVGGAKISEKHANFIINTGGATARDVCAIISTVKTELGRSGVNAQEEIVYIGEFK